MKIARLVYVALLLAAYLSGRAALARDPSPAGLGADFLRADAPAPAALPARTSAPEADDRAQRIQQLQFAMGPYHPALAEAVLDAGDYLYGRGDIAGAIDHWRRGVHLTRVNEGLYSSLQLPALGRLRDTYVQLGDYGAADDIESYLLHLQRQTHAPGEPAYLEATLEWVDWRRRLWLRAPTPAQPRPLVELWRLLDRAGRESDEAPLAVAQLEALVYAQLDVLYVIAGTDFRPEFAADLTLGRAAAGFADSEDLDLELARSLHDGAYRRGRDRLALLAARLGEAGDLPGRARALRALGDWQLWHNRTAAGLASYRESWTALSAHPELRQAWFATPVELPDGSALDHGMATVAEYRGYNLVQARFTVMDTGRVVDVEIRALDPERESGALERVLEKSRFRPRLEAGEPVITEGLEREYRVR